VALGSDLKKQINPEELDELLSGLEKLLDRTKVLYEQYFMGIQKVAPMQLHRDIERKVRELMQAQIRNTSLRFRFTTISQKFGSYNTYWKRTLREIEQGKYVRELVRVRRKAEQQGEELPEELLVKLPKMVQDRIRRDRAKLAERAIRESEHESEHGAEKEAFEAMARAADLPPEQPPPVHEISDEEAQSLFGEGDLDIDGLFQALTEPEEAAAPESPRAPPVAEPPKPVVPTFKTPDVPLPRGLGLTPPPARVTAPSVEGFRVPLPRGGGSRSETRPPAEPPAATPPPAPAAPPAAPPVRAATAPPARPTASRIVTPRAATPPPTPVSQRPPPVPERARTADPAARPPRAPTQRSGGTIPPPPGMDDKQCRELYSRYLKARTLVGEKNDDVTYEKLVSSLSKQATAIMTQHGARGVEFHVVVRGDKVVLKAKPIKTGKPDE